VTTATRVQYEDMKEREAWGCLVEIVERGKLWEAKKKEMRRESERRGLQCIHLLQYVGNGEIMPHEGEGIDWKGFSEYAESAMWVESILNSHKENYWEIMRKALGQDFLLNNGDDGMLWEEMREYAEKGVRWKTLLRFVDKGGDWAFLLATTNRSIEMTQQAISDARRISALTWEQLSQLFGVSRRRIHSWASGQPLNPTNEQRLLRVLCIMKEADRGDAWSNHAALFEANNETTAFDLLSSQRFDDALALLGRGQGRKELAKAELSPSAKAARRPLLPEELVDARQDRIHRDIGRGRAARLVKNIAPKQNS
jgi:DNA-binding transcriptional regulator YiaG